MLTTDNKLQPITTAVIKYRQKRCGINEILQMGRLDKVFWSELNVNVKSNCHSDVMKQITKPGTPSLSWSSPGVLKRLKCLFM